MKIQCGEKVNTIVIMCYGNKVYGVDHHIMYRIVQLLQCTTETNMLYGHYPPTIILNVKKIVIL